MMTTEIINTKICLCPIELDDIRHNIITKLRNNKECTELYGYPMRLVDLISYKNNHITPQGNCIFRVSYTVVCLKPIVGQTYSCVVTEIYPQGIFAAFSKLKILVPATSMEEYMYDDESFVKDDSFIRRDSLVDIELTEIEYTDHEYQCIGILKK